MKVELYCIQKEKGEILKYAEAYLLKLIRVYVELLNNATFMECKEVNYWSNSGEDSLQIYCEALCRWHKLTPAKITGYVKEYFLLLPFLIFTWKMKIKCV